MGQSSSATATFNAADHIAVGWRARLLAKLQGLDTRLSRSQRRYALAGAICLGATFLWLVHLTGLPAGSFVMVGAMIVAWAVFSDGLDWCTAVADTLLGKLCLAGAGVTATTISLALSAQVINEAVGAEPASLGYSITLIGLLNAPIIFIVSLGALFAVVVIVGPLWLMFRYMRESMLRQIALTRPLISSPAEIYPLWTAIVRFVCASLVLTMAHGLGMKALPSYSHFLHDTAQSSVFQFDMYTHSRCALEINERIAHIDDDVVLIGQNKPSGIEFRLGTCESKVAAKK